jgi:hypothetical protein
MTSATAAQAAIGAEGNPALTAATEAILNCRLAAGHWAAGDAAAHRAAILIDALPDAAAALEAATPHIAAAERQRIADDFNRRAEAIRSFASRESDPGAMAVANTLGNEAWNLTHEREVLNLAEPTGADAEPGELGSVHADDGDG